jgi:alkanesulfonate monooxygenase SsuD/methylene tetrahydromethanopterin reductase-like flavin-dependent oxidoreductase (luciferase family)
MEEGIRIMKLMWTEEKPSFKGEYYQIKDSVCEPKPVQKPYPPVTIGGSGEKLTLKIVAKEADRCNFLPCEPEKFKHLLEVLHGHCMTVGRDFDEIEKSLFAGIYLFKNEKEMEAQLRKVYEALKPKRPFDDWVNAYKNRVLLFGTVDDCIKRLRIYQSLGVTCYILRFEGGEHSIPHEEGFELFNEHILNEIRR